MCENEKTVKTYTTAADWLARESAYMRKVARLLGQAGERLNVVLTRCAEKHSTQRCAYVHRPSNQGFGRLGS